MSEPPSSLSGSAYLRLVGLGAVIGIPAAFLAALFLAVVHDVERWLRDSLPSALGRSAPPWYLVIALGSVMGMVVALSRRVRGAGAVCSRQRGLVLRDLGAVRRPDRRRDDEVEGGVALGSALLPILIPGFVAAAIGYVIFIGFGSWGGLHAQSLAVPNLPPYNGTHVYDLLVGIVVGVAAALIVALVRRSCLGPRGPRPRPRRPAHPPRRRRARGRPHRPDLRLVRRQLAGRPLLGPDRGAVARRGRRRRRGDGRRTRLLITSTLFASPLVGTNGLDAVPAAVLAASAAWITAQALDRRSAAAAAGLPVADPG